MLELPNFGPVHYQVLLAADHLCFRSYKNAVLLIVSLVFVVKTIKVKEHKTERFHFTCQVLI